MNISVLGVHRDGGMCERLSLPVGNLYPADDLALDQAASIVFLAIAARGVRRAGVGQGMRTLVIGVDRLAWAPPSSHRLPAALSG